MDPLDCTILEHFEAHDQRGLARAISRAESGAGEALARALHDRVGRALTVGLTGPPGVGKSTLAAALVRRARSNGRSVGVISVDPSSPFSKGAILGDRIRLGEHFDDRDVFIRSMAARGHLGGLAGATADAVAFMDAFGLDVIFVETVGVGQSEIEIAQLAQTTVVVLQPGSGDSVQVLKAGILEVADLFVVNKADHPMALQLTRDVRGMMEMLDFHGWTPPLVLTQAHSGTGIDEVWEAILAHDAYLRASGEGARRRAAAFAHRVRMLVLGAVEERVEREIANVVAHDASAGSDPYAAAARVRARLHSDEERSQATALPDTSPRATVRGL
ncbi:MAG TPA: methylmalonyl Co-A mutase-associated GTPase MeaB [Candidatus Baltobacteraceae bacterium]